MVWRLRETAQADTPVTLEVIGAHTVITRWLQADSDQLGQVVGRMAEHHSPLEEIWVEGEARQRSGLAETHFRQALQRRDVRPPRRPSVLRNARIDRDALGPQPKSVPVVGSQWVALLRRTTTHRLP
jgi:hypothetical protein